MQQSPSW